MLDSQESEQLLPELPKHSGSEIAKMIALLGVQRAALVNREGVESWVVAGRQNTGEAASLRSALEEYSKKEGPPLPLEVALKLKQDQDRPEGTDSFFLMVSHGLSEEELLQLTKTYSIHHNSSDLSTGKLQRWIVNGGKPEEHLVAHGGTMKAALAKLYATKHLGINLLGEDEDYYYLRGFFPIFGERHQGESGVETKVSKEQVGRILNGKQNEMLV